MLKYLICATETISLKPIPHVQYLFPLKDYCVGFPKEYSLEEINLPNSYILINRLLDTESIERLKKQLDNLPSTIKGIVFEDLGVYELIKTKEIEKILYATHANCSKYTVNTYLEKMDSLVISPDITLEETKEILKDAIKPLILYGLGHLPYMYSRRTLNTNYQTHFGYTQKSVLNVQESITKKPFIAVENPYGTVLYDNKLYNASQLKEEENILFILINPVLTTMDTLDAIDFFEKNRQENSTTGFLNQKTIYRLKEKD